MSLNLQAEGKSIFDVLENGILTVRYAQNDHVIMINENIPGQCHIVQDGSTASNSPIQKDLFTQVNISPNSTEVIDMDNLFITATLNVKFKLATSFAQAHLGTNWDVARIPYGTTHYRKPFIRFKNCLNSLKECDILVDSTEIWKQLFVPGESDIFHRGCNDYVRKTGP
jgi:hypothetical protein